MILPLKLVFSAWRVHTPFGEGAKELMSSEDTHRRGGGGSITVQLVSSFTGLGTVANLHTNNNTFSNLVGSKPAKLETSHLVIFQPMVSVR